MTRLNFYRSAVVTKGTEAAKAKVPRQQGIVAVYVVKDGIGSFYAKVNNKKYLIENYKLTTGIVYSKPGMTDYVDWTPKRIDKDLNTEVTFENYTKLDKIWSSLYDGQPITGVVRNNMFILKTKTDKLF